MNKNKYRLKKIPKLSLNHLLTMNSPYQAVLKSTSRRSQQIPILPSSQSKPSLHRRIGSDYIIRPVTSKRIQYSPTSISPIPISKRKSTSRLKSKRTAEISNPSNTHNNIKVFCEPEVIFPVTAQRTALNELANYYEKKASLKISKAIRKEPKKIRIEEFTNESGILNLSPIPRYENFEIEFKDEKNYEE